MNESPSTHDRLLQSFRAQLEVIPNLILLVEEAILSFLFRGFFKAKILPPGNIPLSLLIQQSKALELTSLF